MKTEFKYGDTIPANIRRLEGGDDRTFERTLIPKQWVKVGGYKASTTYENDGSLLWEWAQTNPLRVAKTDVEKARDYFDGLDVGEITRKIHYSSVAEKHAAVIIADAVKAR